MNRPTDLKTKIFLDGGDPEETKEIIKLLGFLDGQTTNPTLISKNPNAQKRLKEGNKFTKEEIFEFYKSVVKEISSIIPQGSVSVEVYADSKTTSYEMIKQGKEFFKWIPNAHIKYPTTHEGLSAAQASVEEDVRVNMTLVFSQEQAGAVYAVTKETNDPSLVGLKNVFVSPFIGRLDDKGQNGMDLIKNILEMYKNGDGHVDVLTASVRSLEHFLFAISLGSDIITAPFNILKEWGEKGMPLPDQNFVYEAPNLSPIDYQKIDLNKDWTGFNIKHELTDTGVERFSTDWNELIK